MQWLDFIDESHPSVVALTKWVERQVPFTRSYLVGQIEALRELAASGDLIYDPNASDDPKAPLLPIRKNPELYELRWKLLNQWVRQYHGEPPNESSILVALHIHLKAERPTQKEEIESAVKVYGEAERRSWAPTIESADGGTPERGAPEDGPAQSHNPPVV